MVTSVQGGVLFSVVIPLYNKEKTIVRCIRSVLNQSIKEFEIIVINDGSTDKSLDVLNVLDDKRIKVFNKENGGVSSARNLGIEKATYEFLAFLDADDEWLPDYLESIRSLIIKYPYSGIYATARYEDSQGSRKVIKATVQKGDDFIIRDYCKEPHIIQTSTMCVTKKIIKVVGNYRNYRIGEDTDFKLRIACKCSIAYLNCPKGIYYLGSENNSFSFKLKPSTVCQYFKWYTYPYKNKYSLFLHTTKKVIVTLQRIYFPHLFKERQPSD